MSWIDHFDTVMSNILMLDGRTAGKAAVETIFRIGIFIFSHTSGPFGS